MDGPERPPSFVVDENVGRLATWLRALGYDTRFPRFASDPELLDLAAREGRVLLTRDRGIARRRAARAGRPRVLLVEGERVWEQLRYVARALRLDLSRAFSRCLDCNAELLPVTRDAVAGQVPPYVYATQQRFSRCPSCQRLYWPGTHWERMQARLAEAVQDEPGPAEAGPDPPA